MFHKAKIHNDVSNSWLGLTSSLPSLPPNPSPNSVANQGPLHHTGSVSLQNLTAGVISHPSYLPPFPLPPFCRTHLPILRCLQWRSSNVSGTTFSHLALCVTRHFILKDTIMLSQTLSVVQSKSKGTSIFCFSNPVVRKLGNDGEVKQFPHKYMPPGSLRPLMQFNNLLIYSCPVSHSPQVLLQTSTLTVTS